MTERPILFNADMVRAILDGRKTQTRRAVKPQPACGCVYSMNGAGDKAVHWNGDNKAPLYVPVSATSASHLLTCPYGQPGDELWVRETWGVGCRPCPVEGWVDGIEYRADEAYLDDIDDLPLYTPEAPPDFYADYDKNGWRPSIHMPRWASRIQLRITDVRVERVQEIGLDDCVAEGCPGHYAPSHPDHGCTDGMMPDEEFAQLWNSIHGDDAWERNDWVWVIEFEVVR